MCAHENQTLGSDIRELQGFAPQRISGKAGRLQRGLEVAHFVVQVGLSVLDAYTHPDPGGAYWPQS